MGDLEPWLTKAEATLRSSDAAVVTERGRFPWKELLDRAYALIDQLPPSRYGWVVPPDGGERSVVALLALGLKTPSPSWVLGDPSQWSTEHTDSAPLPRASALTAPPPEVGGPTYATSSSGTTGRPKLLFGRPHALAEAVELYANDIPEYASAKVFAACSALDFAATFYMTVAPAMFMGRDLLLFRPSQWSKAVPELMGGPGVCLAPPALTVVGARLAAGRDSFHGTCFVPAGGGLTPERANRIADGFPGCGFLTMLGSTETGLLTVDRDVRTDGYVGSALPGKPVWLEDTGADGIGTMWTRGPDSRFTATGGRIMSRPEGAVSAGDLARRSEGGYVLEGRVDDLLKVDGVSVYPREVTTAVRALPGTEDAAVRVERSGGGDRVTVIVVGDVTEEEVREACRGLAAPVVPHRVVRHPPGALSYDERGKVLRQEGV